MPAPEVSIYNDVADVITLVEVDASAGGTVPRTGATLTVFMSTEKATDSAKPNDAPEGTATETATPGDYTVKVEGDVITPEFVDAAIAAKKTIYLHIRDDKNTRIVIACKTVRDREVKVSA